MIAALVITKMFLILFSQSIPSNSYYKICFPLSDLKDWKEDKELPKRHDPAFLQFQRMATYVNIFFTFKPPFEDHY